MWGQFDADASSEAGREEHPAEALPAAAWGAPEPLPPPLGGEQPTEPGGGPQDSENRALAATPDESLPPSVAAPADAPSEPPYVPDSLALPVAPESLPTSDPGQRAAGEEAQPARGDTVPVAMEPRGEPAAAPSVSPAPAAAWIFPAEAETAPAQPSLRRPLPPILPYVRLALRATAVGAAGLIVTVLTLTLLYRWVNPPISTLMIGRSLAGTEIERTWRPLERVSPHLMRAVILSEDGGFCRHRGVDWGALEEAIETDRGGSTITMQVVKNLFLWPSRSYVRKAIEIGLAYLVEAVWPKRRILEIYLNIAEWGDGVFGAEAAAQAHFGKRAARLTVEEAALLAAVLPNPIERTAGAPSEVTSRIASRLATRMRTSRADFSCVPVPRLEPRKAPQKEPMRSPQRLPDRLPDKPPLVQGPRMTL